MHNPNLSLPLGEMSRSDREGWNQMTWLFKFSLTPPHTSGCLAVSPTSQNTVRNTAAMSAESVVPL